MGNFIKFLAVFLLVPFVSLQAMEFQAVKGAVGNTFTYQSKVLSNALIKATELTDDLIRRLETIEDNQKEIMSCAKQDAPFDPDSYSVWDNGIGQCVTITRACVDAPENPIESRELIFIFDASSSMKSTYTPPKTAHECKSYYARYQDECGSKYYPTFKQMHPTTKSCGSNSRSKYCKWCGYKPKAPQKKVVIGTKVDGEGITHDVYGTVYVTEGSEWEKYTAQKEKYETCLQKNLDTQCVSNFNTCKTNSAVENAEEIAGWNTAYAIWKESTYIPYRTCRYQQYNEYLTCVNDFNSIWNTAKSESRIEAAKAAVSASIKSAPTFVDLGLVVFNGCNEIVNHGFYLDADRTDLLKAVAAIEATGTTPLVDSMIIAAENMKIKEEGVNAEGYIVLVTDGEDTCVSKDSAISMKAVCNTAKALKKENDGLVINVLDLSNNSKLSCISEYTGGVYASVSGEGTMLTAIVEEMSKISDVPEYCYAPTDLEWPE